MRYLADTHVILWYSSKSPELSENAKKIIEGEDQIYLSIASFWEISIKKALGKLEFNRSVERAVYDFQSLGFGILDIKPRHIDVSASLPKLHKDPFDRLLIAQAISENMTIITRDEKIPLYAVKTAW